MQASKTPTRQIQWSVETATSTTKAMDGYNNGLYHQSAGVQPEECHSHGRGLISQRTCLYPMLG